MLNIYCVDNYATLQNFDLNIQITYYMYIINVFITI